MHNRARRQGKHDEEACREEQASTLCVLRVPGAACGHPGPALRTSDRSAHGLAAKAYNSN
jgi:hypothetical protein